MSNVGLQSMSTIHPSAVVSPSAKLANDVQVGPFAVIGPDVIVKSGTRIGPHTLIEGNTTIGAECEIHCGAVVGTPPQDVKYRDEPTEVVIGDRTIIREYATINRGTKASGRTTVGSDCMLMSYAHVAHDCVIGNHVVLANAVNMGGHVVIDDWAMVGGITPIHQFVRIGSHAFVGGASRVAKDVPPYVRASGNPIKLFGLNSVGLRRRGFPDEVRLELKRAYRLFFRSVLNVSQAVEKARQELEQYEEVRLLIEFMERSKRGITLAAGECEQA